VRSGRFRPRFKWWFWLFVLDFIVLTWAGSQPPEGLVPMISLIGTIYWFAYFLVILPVIGLTEKPLPVPETIEADFDAHYPQKPGATPAE
jgi:ubiquinol-cytochrome c reductase cytochrome b subunit